MKKSFLIFLFLNFALFNFSLLAQRGDPTLLKKGFHKGNRVGLSFQNDGALAGFNTGIDIRGEWPLGSGFNYIGDLTPMVGVEINDRLGRILHSVTISRGPRTGQSDEKNPITGTFRGWNPIAGYVNPNGESPAMSHLPDTWPIEGWVDHPDWKDKEGVTQWNGYFGRGIQNATQESYFVADDNTDDEFNTAFDPDPKDPTRKGMGLKMKVRGFQWSSFLAQDAIFWLYDITNEGGTVYKKTNFGTVVGGVVGGDGDSGDDLASFDVGNSITYTWDNDGLGNKGQKTGWCAYAFLESPGNPFDGIDNDNDSPDPNSPRFTAADFDSTSRLLNVGDKVVLIDSLTYERTVVTIQPGTNVLYSIGVKYEIIPGVTRLRGEGFIASILNGTIAIPDTSAYNGLDDDLDGLIDENMVIHLVAYYKWPLPSGAIGVRYKNYFTGAGVNDPLIDERRDNDAGSVVSSWIQTPQGQIVLKSHYSGDEDGDWDPTTDDVGSDGVGPSDDGYLGADADGTEGNGTPNQGEPNFGKVDIDESDLIGLTAFNFFNVGASPNMSDDELLWTRMTPGRFDVISPQPQDGDFLYASGFFPLLPTKTERFSIAILFGEDRQDIFRSKNTVQQIYNAGYKFPQPPKKPKITITQENGKVIIYWDGKPTENSKDFITKQKDFQGYKIYRATEEAFRDAFTMTDGYGILKFYKPIAQYDLVDTIQGFFYPSPALFESLGGITYYLGSNSGIVNRFVDSNVVKGVKYFYAVCAYDAGDESKDVFPEENSKTIIRTSSGVLIPDENTGFITPGDWPIGYNRASGSQIQKLQNFRGTGTATLEIVDDKLVRDGNIYQIIFEDSSDQGFTKNWSLIDMITPDTIYIPSTGLRQIVKPGQLVNVPKGVQIVINGKTYTTDTTFFIGRYDTLINRETVLKGETPIVHGFRINFNNYTDVVPDTLTTGWQGITFASPPKLTFRRFIVSEDTTLSGINMPDDYVIEFSNNVVSTSVQDTLAFGEIVPPKDATFKVINVSQNKIIDFVYFTITGAASKDYNIYFKEWVNGKYKRTWGVGLKFMITSPDLPTTGKLVLNTFKPFSHTDVFQFSTQGAKINTDAAKNEMDRIKVVPNPYVVTHEGEPRLSSTQSSGRGERQIRFTHVPPGSKISIFTVRGDLIKTLSHDNIYVGDVYWNLRTEENLDAAYGVYVFVVEAPGIGTKTGKFALIK